MTRVCRRGVDPSLRADTPTVTEGFEVSDREHAVGEAALASRVAELRAWQRWGDQDQFGAINLVSDDKVLEAVASVRHGRSMSLARPFPVRPSPNNTRPAAHHLRMNTRGDRGSGSASDHLAISFHGQGSTHIDALCHVWNEHGMWNGRSAAEEFTFDGMRWGGIEHWARRGIVTRAVLVDVAAAREKGFVETGEPVTGDEVAQLLERQGCPTRSGDAIVLNCGREAWERAHGRLWSTEDEHGDDARPGVDESILEFAHAAEISTIVWDMMDARPNPYGAPHTAHLAIPVLGLALVDNASLEGLVEFCRAKDQYDFMLVLAPLEVVGGTGSPISPLAVL